MDLKRLIKALLIPLMWGVFTVLALAIMFGSVIGAVWLFEWLLKIFGHTTLLIIVGILVYLILVVVGYVKDASWFPPPE